MLSRSKQVPFSLRMSAEDRDLDFRATADAVNAICSGARRLQEYHVYGEPPELEECLALFPQEPTPLPLSLRIESEFIMFPEIPEHVFTHPKPNLQMLLMQYCEAPWETRLPLTHGQSPFPDLRALYILQAGRPSAQFLKSLLTFAPQLQVLHLDKSIPNDLTYLDPVSDRPIQLSQLKHFTVWTTLAEHPSSIPGFLYLPRFGQLCPPTNQ